MSRLPAPDSGWRESTEGDLDHDLTDEAGSHLEDWNAPLRTPWTMVAVRALSVLLLVAILGVAIAGMFFR